MSARILVIEDEAPIRVLLNAVLSSAGFEATDAVTGEAGLAACRASPPDLVLLDLMLPGMSGLAVARELRRDDRTKAIPIIMLTAKAAEADRVGGLELGADDYITKPFSNKELVARIRALLRRAAPEKDDAPLSFGPLTLEPDTHRVTVDAAEVDLAPTEYRLLHFLMARPNRVFSRSQLLDAVWGEQRFVEDRTVDVCIRRIRMALGGHGEVLIRTVRGFGYKFATE